MANDATGRESDKFMLRLPDGMRERLKTAAEANKRSMNAEIVARLEASLNSPVMRELSPEESQRLALLSRYQKDVHDRDLIQNKLNTISSDIQKMEEAMRAAGISLPIKRLKDQNGAEGSD